MIAALCCVLVLSSASAEVKAEKTEANGKVTQIEWKDETGPPTTTSARLMCKGVFIYVS